MNNQQLSNEGGEQEPEESLATRLAEPSGSDAPHVYADDHASVGSRFNLLRPHKTGGLGEVFLADDRELNRRVALKEIRRQFAYDPSSQSRFVTEACVTGALEHPGIVPVYGMGRHSDGRPYYAMRFVQGTTLSAKISEFHADHITKPIRLFYSREFKSLLRSFIELCSAIYYAHEHGVLHRDIKPENVMLGSFGETLVIDWGLAKNLLKPTSEPSNESLSTFVDRSPIETEMGSVIGTPSYMSPEQASGKLDEVRVTSDIYSLGAVLFNLLTGARSVDGATSEQVLVKVRAGELRSIERLCPSAPRALISICNRAMQLKPVDRYQQVGELIEDVERWLADEKVLAHRNHEGLIERMGRVLRKYHTWALATGIFVLTLAIVLGIALFAINQSRMKEHAAKIQAERSQQDAMARYRQSRQAIDTWLVGSNEVIKHIPGSQPIRKRMLELATDDYKRLASSPSRDPDLELERSRALVRLGDLLGEQGKTDEAIPRYRSAMEVLDSIERSSLPETVRATERASARLHLGIAYVTQQNFSLAETEFNDAIATLETVTTIDRASATVLSLLANGWMNRGELEQVRGDHRKSVDSLTTALDYFGKLYLVTIDGDEDRGMVRDRVLGRLRCLELFGRAVQTVGRNDEASEVYLQAITEFKDQPTDDPDVRAAFASLLVSTSGICGAKGFQKEREHFLQDALTLYETLANAFPNVLEHQRDRLLTLIDLGIAYQDHNRSMLSVQKLRQANKEWGEWNVASEVKDQFEWFLAANEDCLAMAILDAEDNPQLAKLSAESALGVYSKLDGELGTADTKFRLAVSRSHLGKICARLGEHDRAIDFFNESVRVIQELSAASPENQSYRIALGHVFNNLAEAHLLNDDDESAASHFTAAIKTWEQLVDQGNVMASIELASICLTCPSPKWSYIEKARLIIEKHRNLLDRTADVRAIFVIALLLNHEVGTIPSELPEKMMASSDSSPLEWFAVAMFRQATGQGDAIEWYDRAEKRRVNDSPGNTRLKRFSEIAKKFCDKHAADDNTL